MIKENQKHFNRLHVVIDAVVIIISYFLAWLLKFHLPILRDEGGRLPFHIYMSALLFIVPAYLMLYYAFSLYTPKRVQGRRLEFSNIFKANTLGLFLLITGLYLIKQIDFSRHVIVIFYAINVVSEELTRMLIRVVLRKMRAKGYNQKHILLVGYSRACEEYIDRILANPQWGYTIRGILDDNVQAGYMYRGIKVLGRIDNLMVILPQNHLDEIAITLGLSEYFRLEQIVALCEKSGVHTLGLPVINIRYVPLTNTFNAFTKRVMDIVGACVAIILFSPVMLFSVIMIKLTSPGPLIYKQERVGLHNHNFLMYKFRSMEVQPPEEEKKAWTVKNDPRVTNFGRFMRKTSIDELPQLFNVLKGEMSLVGPRPERPFFVDKFREEIPRYMIKHQVRPGLTGWAQVNGYRGNTSIRKRIEYDLYYIENWTLGLDIKILILTFFKGFINKNAY